MHLALLPYSCRKISNVIILLIGFQHTNLPMSPVKENQKPPSRQKDQRGRAGACIYGTWEVHFSPAQSSPALCLVQLLGLGLRLYSVVATHPKILTGRQWARILHRQTAPWIQQKKTQTAARLRRPFPFFLFPKARPHTQAPQANALSVVALDLPRGRSSRPDGVSN